MIETRDTHEDGSLDNRFFASVLFILRVTPASSSALTSTLPFLLLQLRPVELMKHLDEVSRRRSQPDPVSRFSAWRSASVTWVRNLVLGIAIVFAAAQRLEGLRCGLAARSLLRFRRLGLAARSRADGHFESIGFQRLLAAQVLALQRVAQAGQPVQQRLRRA